MTIALGILTPDGVVIAADTQESWGSEGAAKTSGQKIITRLDRQHRRACSATGAGWAGYLDAINQALTDRFLAARIPQATERALRAELQKFYAAHILPQCVYPPDDQPAVDVLMGLSWANSPPMLLANQRSAFRRCKEYVAVGAGSAHASMLLGRLLPPKAETTVDLAAYLAAYVIFHVKSYVIGCGMDTHVTVLKDGNAKYLSRDTISMLEYHFQAYLDVDAQAVNYLIGRPVRDEARARAALSSWLAGARSDIVQTKRVVLEITTRELDWVGAQPPPRIESGLVQVIDESEPPKRSVLPVVSPRQAGGPSPPMSKRDRKRQLRSRA